MSTLRVSDLAQRQHGLVTTAQLRLSATDWEVRRLVTSGLLLPAGRGIYRWAGIPVSWRQRAMGACLQYGPPVALSHRGAARLWELEAIATPSVEVTVPPGRSGRRSGVVTHRAPLPDSEVAERFAIPVTTPDRTLADLAGRVPVPALERALDDALRRRLVSLDGVEVALAAKDGRGRIGVACLRRLVAERADRPGVGDSAWVDRVRGWVVAAGLPAPVPQYKVMVAGSPRWLDLAYPRLKIAIEFNGWEFHGQRHRSDLDHIRTTELQLAGWIVIVVTSGHSEADTVDRVRRAIGLRGGERSAGTGRH